jgi:predicted nicotinamide N-methyase
MPRGPRSFVLRHTALRAVPGVEAVRLHLADDVLPLWRAVQVETRDADAPIPYWAFAWAGGLAVASYLRERPEAVAGQRVLDLGSGSGLCAIAAAAAGASGVLAADIDPFAAAAIRLNARANDRRVSVWLGDPLDASEPPDVDVILAGDCLYEAPLAEKILPWLHRANRAGIDVLIGDPGRRYLPTSELVELARYDVRTTTELEDLDRKQAAVFTFTGSDSSPGTA